MRSIAAIGTVATMILTFMASPAMAVLSFFDVISDSEVIAGPPYPTSCHRTDVAHESSGLFERDGQLALGVRRATDCAGGILSMELRADECHAPGCGFEESTHFDVVYYGDPGGAAGPSQSAVSFMVELTSLRGLPGKLIALHPELPVTDPGRFFDSYWDRSSLALVCQVEFDHGVRHELTLYAELPPGLGLTRTTVAIREHTIESGGRVDPTLVNSFFSANPDGFFDVKFRLEGDAGFEDSSTVLSLTFSGRFLGGTSPVEATTWGAIKSHYRY